MARGIILFAVVRVCTRLQTACIRTYNMCDRSSHAISIQRDTIVHETVSNSQVQSHALRRRGFGTSVPFSHHNL